jgi:hypothetical protein
MTGRASGPWAARYAAKALLGYVLDTRLTGSPPVGRATALVPDAWDAWWACFRAGLPLGRAGIRVQAGDGSCPECAGRAARLAVADPPEHPGTEPSPCGCLLRWAAAMRSPGPVPGWPSAVLSLAIIKPGAPADRVHDMVGSWFDVLGAREVTLTTDATRRLYPEAYGAGYVADRDAYMTSGPVRILTLRARNPDVNSKDVKAAIRREVAVGDSLRNHLHMPDNPGEALADIAQFAGYHELAELHRRYERDHAAGRLAFYRAALGISQPSTHRLPAAG